MSEQKHTTEFGKASCAKNNVAFSETEDLASVTAQVIGGNKDVNRLYARRIVACFNALQEFPTEVIEKLDFLREHMRCHDLEKQRDELMAAIDQVSATRNIGSAHIIARSAIARAKDQFCDATKMIGSPATANYPHGSLGEAVDSKGGAA